MAISNKEKHKRRVLNNKRYNAYINKDLAFNFDDKLKKNNITFSSWLRENIKKYLEN